MPLFRRGKDGLLEEGATSPRPSSPKGGEGVGEQFSNCEVRVWNCRSELTDVRLLPAMK